MPKNPTYNFRYTSQREEFYNEISEQMDKWQKHWEETKGKIEARELTQAMRVTYDVDTSGDFSEVDESGQGKGKMRGYRTFRDLRILRQTIFNVKSSGYELTRRVGHYHTTAKIVVFRRRGKRITGETILWTAHIISK